MSRTHSPLSRNILEKIGDGIKLSVLFRTFEVEYERKVVYDCLFRLLEQGVISWNKSETDPRVNLTHVGTGLLSRLRPTKDGIWKIVIFDIPEKKREVRSHLRSKLKILGFQKWQESIWISPYKLDPDIEEEFRLLADRFFVRLIKTTSINNVTDLEKLFPE